MARRRRAGFARRGRTPVSWVTAVFTGQTQELDGTLTEYSLLDAGDFSFVDPDGAVSGLTVKGKVRRCLGSAGLHVETLTVANGRNALPFFWAVYIIDEEDTDNSIVITSGTGSILNKHRVLASGIESWTALEVAGAVLSNGNAWPQPLIRWDARVNATLRPDDALVLGIQLPVSVAGTVASITSNVLARTLIITP